MPHPFELLPGRWRLRLVGGAIAAAIALLAALAALDAPLRTDQASLGIISLELAFSEGRAAEIVGSWELEGNLSRAAFGLGLDYLYAVIYALALALGCLATARAWRLLGRAERADLGLRLVPVAAAAALFDWIENTALAVILLDVPAAPWPAVAGVAAVPKFAAVTACLIYALSGVRAVYLRRGRG